MKRQIIGLARRSFLTRVGAGTAAFGAALAGFAPPADAGGLVGAPADGWQPARHAEDDWFDASGAVKHKFFLDSTTADALGRALLFTNNYFTANKAAYGLADADVSVVLCVRHESTPFAFSDAMWAKYGAALAQRIAFTDPKTKEAPVVNVYQATGYGPALRSNGVTLDSLTKRGMRLAVCQMSTRANANAIVQKFGGNIDEVFKELTEHLVPGSHLVPAGIVAVNRAQEHGYSFAYIG